MHDPQFGLGIDTKVHLWHPCEAKAEACNHNDVAWVDLTFERQLTLRDGTAVVTGWSREQVVVQVRREAARDLMCRLLELFPVEAGNLTFTPSNVSIRKEEPCQDATAEES